MKKISLFIVSVLFLLPVSVLAATNPTVLTLTATNNDLKITYQGTTEDEAHAVMCKLYDSSDKEVDKLSSAVENNSFNGELTAPKAGTYTVACANYEGGEIKKAEVTIEKDEEPTETEKQEEIKKEDKKISSTAKNPNTGDKIMLYASLLIISILGIGLIIKFKKNAKN